MPLLALLLCLAIRMLNSPKDILLSVLLSELFTKEALYTSNFSLWSFECTIRIIIRKVIAVLEYL